MFERRWIAAAASVSKSALALGLALAATPALAQEEPADDRVPDPGLLAPRRQRDRPAHELEPHARGARGIGGHVDGRAGAVRQCAREGADSGAAKSDRRRMLSPHTSTVWPGPGSHVTFSLFAGESLSPAPATVRT